jgi:hypothetical protein
MKKTMNGPIPGMEIRGGTYRVTRFCKRRNMALLRLSQAIQNDYNIIVTFVCQF